jgi:hypothetical protein
MREKGKDFEKLFLEAVDEGLKVLGESGKQMVFFHLEKSYSVKGDEIPKKPEAFIMGLQKIFGAGSAVVEKLILETLHSKLGLKYEGKGDYTLTDYLNYTKYLGKERSNKFPPKKEQAPYTQPNN